MDDVDGEFVHKCVLMDLLYRDVCERGAPDGSNRRSRTNATRNPVIFALFVLGRCMPCPRIISSAKPRNIVLGETSSRTTPSPLQRSVLLHEEEMPLEFENLPRVPN